MSRSGPRFPELPFGGDHAGARRMRRAFRLTVMAVVLFTFTLWFTEYFLRYPHTERLYLSGITLPNEAAGLVMLRQAVKINTESSKSPSPKYLQALAEREEPDNVLSTFKKAYALDPANSFLAIRYGCRLYAQGHIAEARDRFREAAVHPPENALPAYLEAAMLPWIDEGAPDRLGDSLALVTRTNGNDAPVVFPRPLWFPNLPQDGQRYAELRRDIGRECCAPLRRYARLIMDTAARQIDEEHVQGWDARLETLQTMGRKLAESSEPGALQTIVGLQIQLDALRLRERIAAIEQGAPDRSLIEQQVKTRAALEIVEDFEGERKGKIAADRAQYEFPLRLVLRTSGVVLLGYFLVYTLSKLVRARRFGWAVPHTRFARQIILGGAALILVLLHIVMVLQHTSHESSAWMPPIRWVWWFAVAALLLFGAIYPALALPTIKAICEQYDTSERSDPVERAAARRRRIAYVSLMRRYYGVLVGVVICVFSLWIVSHRIFVSLYPWQKILLTSGLYHEEAEAVRRALALMP